MIRNKSNIFSVHRSINRKKNWSENFCNNALRAFMQFSVLFFGWYLDQPKKYLIHFVISNMNGALLKSVCKRDVKRVNIRFIAYFLPLKNNDWHLYHGTFIYYSGMYIAYSDIAMHLVFIIQWMKGAQSKQFWHARKKGHFQENRPSVRQNLFSVKKGKLVLCLIE